MTELSYCLLDAEGRVAASRGELEQYYAASTVKLAVLVAVVAAIEAGELAYDDELDCPATFPSGAPGAPDFPMDPDDNDESYPAGGTATVRELAWSMITVSSNEATNVLVMRLGFSSVMAALARADAVGCTMERLLADLAARDQGIGRSNQVTALGLARLMRGVVTGALAGPAGTAFMIECLAAQRFPVIGRVLPAGTWGSKSGWIHGIEHDVAFADGPTGTRVLAVLTSGYAGREAQPAIEAVARELLLG